MLERSLLQKAEANDRKEKKRPFEQEEAIFLSNSEDVKGLFALFQKALYGMSSEAEIWQSSAMKIRTESAS